MQRHSTTPVKTDGSKTSSSFEKVGDISSTSKIEHSNGIQKHLSTIATLRQPESGIVRLLYLTVFAHLCFYCRHKGIFPRRVEKTL